ncbi:NAD-dependent succinate-semialdehyde dehydrogenase [Daejeonella lutea]|uniref:Succinate-semialdehyde dehydrogenase / glutarate-semialdehyde dehydrogenase n=1 Tax=Daejeonella lutea TaxID=572036 RepID=A0A1T5AT82_9SPHI|nr:NAD-dependent succinate-semialdehyde dehydrogenase [Daejeonella lutea]SKB38067.1 succinate-semialdehyde dehydrogenase / glutarate-semialdehyde dehydrogenase [Daejeonella lutea]
MKINSTNPFDGAVIQSYTPYSAALVDGIISDMHTAWDAWREVSFAEKSTLLHKTAQILRARKSALAMLMSIEMGKPLKSGITEIEKCAECCEFYAINAEDLLKQELVSTDARKSYVTFEPIGVVLAIMPWNFPFWQVIRFLAPTLMAGNCGVLKHASNVFGCALEIENIIKEAGFPDNVFRTLLIPGSEVERVIENEFIAAVTLTGSTAAGKKVAQKAGSLIKKTVLELGGSDAYIVLEDADLELAAETCVNSRMINSGQSCIAAKRFIVAEPILDQFTDLFVRKMASKIMGDPADEKTDIGPQARTDLRDQLHEQVKASISKGAICLLGGFIPEGNNAFYPPTVLTNVAKGMPAYDEELFGPVAAIISAKNENQAIQIANDSIYGLGAAIFSRNIERAEKIAATQLQAGSCFVNALVKSDSRLPFGGIKQSGYGRELSNYGIKEFVNIKTVYIGG